MNQMSLKDVFKERLLDVQKKISSTPRPYGNTDVSLVAVTKYSEVQDLEVAYSEGLCDFGENRVQALEEKASAFKSKNLNDVRWHFIGNLQSNKVSKLLVVPNLVSIHSISSMKLLKAIYKKAGLFSDKTLDLFLEVNTSGEDEKHGFKTIEELFEAFAFSLEQNDSKVQIKGLMTMGKIRTDDFEKDAKLCFSKLREMKDTIDEKYNTNLSLSMGMSRDYHLAIEEGANFVRVGSTLFK